MRAWRFKKPVTPGFGIAKDYYLSVLASSATLPSMLQILNPKGDIGAVVGFGAPLASGASKDDLALPLKHGAYVLASKDQKTVLKMLLMPPQDAGSIPRRFLGVLLRSITAWIFRNVCARHGTLPSSRLNLTIRRCIRHLIFFWTWFRLSVPERTGLLQIQLAADTCCRHKCDCSRERTRGWMRVSTSPSSFACCPPACMPIRWVCRSLPSQSLR